jgi:hypothetical protein
MRNPGQSIRSKLMLVVLVTTATALVVVAIALVVYESRAYEQGSANALMTQAQILGRASAPALVFDDPVAARENLALLKVQPRIRAAAGSSNTSAGALARPRICACVISASTLVFS